MSGKQPTPIPPTSATGGDSSDPLNVPKAVRPIRVLGAGRAAEAVLVEATFHDDRKQICVEKVFAAGWLTRTIYRLSFQAPFAYQSNRDAILTCFYRRRVAAAVLAVSETGVKIATPLYVRFDPASGAWVLAAQWIDGRGIKPAPADRYRLRRRLSNGTAGKTVDAAAEIDSLVDTMHQLEVLLNDCGLVGSGWQVAPRALVSTANLLREADHYTVIDLESGIPAVLVPKYLISGAQRGELPPFDDLDEDKLRNWVEQNDRLLLFRLGPEGLTRLRDDIEKLIKHSSRWKATELAVLRRPWRLLRRNGMVAYRQECVRRWQQERIIDAETAGSLTSQSWKARLIWYAGLLPGSLGRHSSRMIGNREYRDRVHRFLGDREYRSEQFNQLIRERESKWIESQRLSPESRLTPLGFVMHRLLSIFTPRAVHRFVSDRRLRNMRMQQAMLLLLSPRYQSWFGHQRIEASIDSWHRSQRISRLEAERLRKQLSGREVRAYVRGLGAHMALKTFAPIIAPAKYGGLAAFLASGNLWFLLPMILMPAVRTAVTLTSWWSTRDERIPHGEALLAGLLPIVGSAAFPLQMYSARSDLSVFLIRDAASKLGRCIPIYGGPNSRTEIAMIRSADMLLELLDIASTLTRKLFRSARPEDQQSGAKPIEFPVRTGLGRFVNQLALKQIADHDSRRTNRREHTDNDSTRDLEAA